MPTVCNALRTDPDSGVRCSAAEALGNIGSEEAIPALSEALKDKASSLCAQANKRCSGRNKDLELLQSHRLYQRVNQSWLKHTNSGLASS